ncbi:MAG: BatA domain-containing protein [Bacteroidia bacterium]
MMFVYPTFLWALLAIAIPIIIHLFNFRRYKKVYFTNVKFLKELRHESKSKSRLKEILILAARCLAIASLVIAFCQPVAVTKNTKLNPGANAISIYIDNSFSMENVQKQGPLLSIAQLRAKDIVKAYGNADKFQLITNDFEGKHQRFYTKDDILNAIEEVKISPSVRQLSSVIKRQNEFLQSSGAPNKKIYAVSDAQRSTFDFETLKNDTTIKISLVPLSANQVNNVYVDSCWFETPLQQKGFIQKLHATIVNTGNSAINAGSAKLFLNKQQLALSSFSVEAGSKKEILFTFECKQSGFNFGSIKIEDYPITFDDELFFSFNSKINITVTLINGKSQTTSNAFESLFKSDSLFRLTSFNEQAIDYSAFKTSDVIVLNELPELSSGLLSEILKFMEKGGSLLIVPAVNSNLVSYGQFLSSLQLPVFTALDTFTVKTDKIETANKFYTGVFEKMEERINLPVITKHFKVSAGSRTNFESILSLQNSEPLLGVNKFNNGLIYLSTAPFSPDGGNISKHALFVPTVYRICFNSLKSTQLFYEVNSNSVLTLKNETGNNDQPPHIKEINKKADIIPEIHTVNNNILLYTRGQVTLPGFYEVVKNSAAVFPLAFNYSRKESNLACYPIDEIQKVIDTKGYRNIHLLNNTGEDISRQILEDAEGKKLWKLFILLALTFVLIEILLLRFLK